MARVRVSVKEFLNHETDDEQMMVTHWSPGSSQGRATVVMRGEEGEGGFRYSVISIHFIAIAQRRLCKKCQLQSASSQHSSTGGQLVSLGLSWQL